MVAVVLKLQSLQDDKKIPKYPAYYGGVVRASESSWPINIPAHSYTDRPHNQITLATHALGDLNRPAGEAGIPCGVYTQFREYVLAMFGRDAFIVETGNPQSPLAVASLLRGRGNLMYVSQTPHLSAPTPGVKTSHWHITDIIDAPPEYATAAQTITHKPGSSEDVTPVTGPYRLIIKERVYYDLIQNARITSVYNIGPKRHNRYLAAPEPHVGITTANPTLRRPRDGEAVGLATDREAVLTKPQGEVSYTYSVFPRLNERKQPDLLTIDAPSSAAGHPAEVLSPRSTVGRTGRAR